MLKRIAKILLILLIITYPTNAKILTPTCEIPKYTYRKINIIATAYCSCPKCTGKKSKGIAASGKPVSRGMIAAPHTIPFGTKIYIPNLGIYIVEDRGGKIRQINKDTIRIDIYIPSHKEAQKFGVKKFVGWIYNNN